MNPFFVAVERFIKIIFLFLLTVAFLLGSIPPSAQAAPDPEIEQAPFYAPTASVSLDVPTNVMVGENFTFTATFANTSGTSTDVGYGPFIDIVFPVTGVDGAGAAVDDGIDFLGGTYLGSVVTAVQNTFGAANTGGCSGGLGPVTHPYAVTLTTGAPVTVCGVPGDKLVTLQLPFGSFVPDQPPAGVTVSARLSNLADVGTALNLYARGGYQFGATPLSDWCCGDATILTPSSPNSPTWTSNSTTPTITSITKTYVGPEDETATGPNFPRRYTVRVDIASGQTITNLSLTDTLPDSLQYSSFISSTPAGCTLTSTPSTSSPGGVLTCLFASVTGGTGTNDASFTFEFYVPLVNSIGRVLDPDTGDDIDITNAADFSGTWTPIDTRDVPTTVSGVCPNCHTLTAKSIAIQKGVVIQNDVGYPGDEPDEVSPGDTVEYTLSFQVSDFFAFDQVDITDILSDGLRLDGTFAPILVVNGNSYTIGVPTPLDMDLDNVDVACNYTGGLGAECDTDDPAPNNGRTTIVFNISQEIQDQVGTDRLIGGCVDPAGGSATPDCGTYQDGPTIGTIVYRAVVQDLYSDDYPSGDPSVDHGDVMSNLVTVGGRVLDTDDFTSSDLEEADSSGSDLIVAFGSVQKTVYALNSDTGCGGSCANVRVKPGDTLTYRIQYAMPSSDFEPTTIGDYLPLPVFRVNDPDANGAVGPAWSQDLTAAAAPPAGQWKYGPADTLHLTPPGGPTPVISIDTPNNELQFDYPAFDDPTNTSTRVDLLFSIKVSSEPFADLLKLTNQVHVAEGTTQLNPTDTDAIVQITLTEPVLTSKKGVVATDSPLGTFNPALSAPTFNVPGTSGTRWTGTISSANVANIATANLSGVDAGDLVTFAIVIVNSGTSANGAFDITIQDILQAGYVIPTNATGLNLRVANGDNSVSYSVTGLGGGPDGVANTADDIFGSGIRINDPNEGTATPYPGACQAHHATNGHNILVISYDLQIADNVTPNQGIINTASLVRYAGSEGGPNYLSAPLTDTAMVTPFAAPAKVIVTTSELHTGVVTGNERLAVGEIVRYRVYSAIPEGSDITDLQLRDNLPNGLQFLDDNTTRVAFVSSTSGNIVSTTLTPALTGCANLYLSGSAADLAGLPSASITCPLPDTSISNSPTVDNDAYGTGTDVYFKLGNVRNNERDAGSEYVVVEFNAIALNTNASGSSNQAFDNLNGTLVTSNRDNSALMRSGTTDISSASPNIRVIVAEPLVRNLDKIELTTGPYDAGDTLTYQLTFSNTASGNNAATAFDLALTDTLSSALDFVSVNVTSTQTNPCVGNGAGTTPFTTSNSLVSQLLTVNVSCLDPNRSVTVTVNTRVNETIPVGSTLTNTGYVTYTSLPGRGNSITVLDSNGTLTTSTPGTSGSATGERNGTPGSEGVDTALLNNYSDSDSITSTTGGTYTISKQLTTTSAPHTSGSNVAIGEDVTYGILLTFPEGTTLSDTVVDTLPVGLQVVGTPQVITSAAASGGALTNDFNGSTGTPAPAITTTLLPTGEYRVSFVFTNVAVNGDNAANNNTLLMRIDARVMDIAANATGTVLSNSATNQVGAGVPAISNAVGVTVVQPDITFEKTIVSLPTPLDAGGVVHYRITYANGNGANVSTAMDVNITDALAAALLLPSISAPDIVVTTTAGVGAVTNNSTASNVNIVIASVPPGESVTVDFYPAIQSSVTPGQVIDNTGNSTWTSLSGAVAGERTGASGPSGSPDNYAAVSNVQFTMPLSQTITKQLTATSAVHTAGSNVAIGEVITYDILLTFPEGMTPSDTVVDDLPTGLEVTGIPEVITAVAASGGLLTADFNGSMDAPTITVTGTNDIVTFGFANVSLPGDNNIANNTIVLRFRALVLNVDDNDNADTLSNSATNQVGAAAPTSSNTVNATVVESRLDLTKQVTDPNPAVGEVLTFTLLLNHDAASTADAFDVVLTDDLPVELTLDVSSVQVTTGGTGAVTNLRTNHSANHIEVTADSLEQGATIQVTYQATVTGPYASSFHNDAVATWTSLPGTVSGERDGSSTPAHNDYRSTAQTAINVYRALVKNLVASNVTGTSPDDVVTIGEILTYQVVLTIPAGSTDLAIITDTLDSGLAFVDCADTAPAGAGNMHDIIAGPDITSTNFTFAADAHGHNVASCNHGTTAANNPQISNSGGTIRWDLGTVANAGAAPETIALTYRVIVLDVATNVQNTTLDNDVDWIWSGGTLSTRAAQSLRVVEPELQVEKTVDPEVAALGNSVTYSVEISHTSNSLMAAYDVLLTDGIPTGLVLDQTSVTVTGSAGLPAAVITTSPTQFTVYWSEFPLGATARVEFQARFVGPSPVVNSANVNWSSLQIDPVPHFQAQSVYNALSTERRFNPANQSVDDYVVSSSVSLKAPKLPKTGFAPGKVTSLPEQPADMSYRAMGDLWLEIPRLGIKVNIVGVPYNSDDWNLTWLGNQAGYLEDTAYPTHAGNTGITAHAYLADGTPGPFVDLSKLHYGDQIIIHMGGQRYLYEVRENKLIRPNEASVLKHEEHPWLTLITCKNYNETTGDYQYRVSVRAVLVKVENE